MTYRFSSLLAWRNRKVDLANADDWLDLLDDFGPALLRFLVDERYAAFVPDSEGMLSSLKVSLSKSPLSTLKCTRGSVWILFAYKEGLCGLPQPFRQEGLLLPFEWTREDRPQTGVPHGLVELSERVKEQFGAVGEPWHLVLPEYFAGHVDLDLEGSTYESAWGALASGLFLALHRRARLVAWPFSSVAFDFVRGEPIGVGELSAKILLASSMGAEEVSVAPSQQTEARRELAALRVRHPDDRNLRRLKIFRWKWTGEVPSSVKSLVCCNQRFWSPWKKVLAVNAAVVALALTAAAAYWWDWNREVVRYFANSELYFGRYCVKGEMPEAEARRRGCYTKATYRGYDRHGLGRSPLMSSLVIVGRTKANGGDSTSLATYHYDLNRNLSEIRLYDAEQKLKKIRRFSPTLPDTAEEVTVKADGSVDESQSRITISFGKTGRPRRATLSKSSGDFEQVDFNSFGSVITQRFFTAEGAPVGNHEGICGFAFEYDCKGRKTAFLSLDAAGRPATSAVTGAMGILFHYDDSCGRMDQTRVDENRRPVCGKLGVVHESEWRNAQGKVVRAEFRDEKDRLQILPKLGYAAITREYDAQGRTTVEAFWGCDNKLTRDVDGIAVVRHEYLDGGRRARLRYFDESDSPCVDRSGIGGVDLVFDEAGNEIERCNVGLMGLACDNNEGYFRVVRTFDRRRRVLSERRFNALGAVATWKKMLGQDEIGQVAQVDFAYDRLDNATITMRAKEGSVLLGGARGLRLKRSRMGQLTEQAFLDVNGNLFDSDLGYARVEYDYNRFREQVATTHFDSQGNRSVCKKTGVWQGTNDIVHTKQGIRMSVRFCGTDGFPTEHLQFGIAGVDASFDFQGQVQSVRAWNVRAEAVPASEALKDELKSFTRIRGINTAEGEVF